MALFNFGGFGQAPQANQGEDPGLLQSIFMASRPGQRYYQVKAELEKRSALKDLANNMGGVPTDGSYGPIQPPDDRSALLRYAAATGDLSPLGLGVDAPSAVREYQYFSKLPQSEQNKYLSVKRAAQIMD